MSAVPIGVTGAWFSLHSLSARQTVLQLHREVADLAADTVSRHMASLDRRMDFRKRYDAMLRSASPAQADSARLEKDLRDSPDIIAVSLLDSKGREVRSWSASNVVRNFGELYLWGRPAFDIARENRRLGVSVTILSSLPAVVTVEPVSADRFLFVAVSLESLWNELARHQIGETGQVAIFDPGGLFLPRMGRAYPPIDAASLKSLISAADSGWSEAIRAGPHEMVGAFQRVAGLGVFDWYVLTLQPREEAYLGAGRLALMFGGVVGLAALLSAAAASMIAASAAGPVEELGFALDRLGLGEEGRPLELRGGPDERRLRMRYNDAIHKVRERLEEARARSLEEKTKVETLIFNIPDAIVMTNLRGEVLYINTPAMTTLGVRPEEVTQADKGLFELIRSDQLRASVQNIIEKHTRSEIVEIEVPGPDGPLRRFFDTTVAMFAAPGSKDFGVLMMMRDVTAERELTQMKEEFFHSVAHDLRAPLFAIQGYLRLLEKGVAPDPRLKGYFDAIYQSCDKLTLFIQDILDSTRLEAGQLKLTLTAIEPLSFLQRAQKLFNPVCEEKGIRLELKYPQDYPGSVDADDRLLERVLSNLVSNALKFTPRGGTITIEVGRAGPDQVEFAVSDTGPGVPKEKRSIIFEKFTQLGGGQQRAGFGLGLNICRKIVELHGGRIWVDSEVGKGSSFIFRLPLKQKT